MSKREKYITLHQAHLRKLHQFWTMAEHNRFSEDDIRRWEQEMDRRHNIRLALWFQTLDEWEQIDICFFTQLPLFIKKLTDEQRLALTLIS